MTGASAPVSRREMIGLMESNIDMLSKLLEEHPNSNAARDPKVVRMLQVYTAISLKLRMEENPNAQD